MESKAPPFPLYNELKNSKNPAIEGSKLCAMINVLESREHLGIIFALILHHNRGEPQFKGSHRLIPYNGRLISKDRGLRFEIDRMPAELVKIIGRYLALISD